MAAVVPDSSILTPVGQPSSFPPLFKAASSRLFMHVTMPAFGRGDGSTSTWGTEWRASHRHVTASKS